MHQGMIKYTSTDNRELKQRKYFHDEGLHSTLRGMDREPRLWHEYFKLSMSSFLTTDAYMQKRRENRDFIKVQDVNKLFVR